MGELMGPRSRLAAARDRAIRLARTRLGRILVRSGLTMLVVWVGLGVFVRMARATVYERLLGMGSDMAKFLDDGDTTGKPRDIRLNGQKLQVATGSTTQSVQDVIGFYNKRYGGRDGGMRQHFQKMIDEGHTKDPERLRKLLAKGPLNALSEVRGDGGGDLGFSAFTDLGPGDGEPRALFDRVHKFGRTGQLSDMGAAYYVYARKSGDKTSFFLLWADKDFNVFDLVGGKDDAGGRGDVPGEDLPGVPRFPGGRRFFSSSEPAKNYAVAGYDLPADPGSVQAFYRARMAAEGWVADQNFERALAEVRKQKDVVERALRFSRGQAHLVMSFEAKDDGHTRMAVAGHTKS